MKNDLPAALAVGSTAGAAAPGGPASTLALQVRQIRHEGMGIQSYELVDPEGGILPTFEAGAHLDLHLPGGVIRQYSISSDPAELHHYVIGVLRDEQGRGGSKAVHEHLRVQDMVRVSLPRNNFALVRGARKVVLLAGGIGVTPLKSMAHELERAGVDYELHYCAKDARSAAFRDELRTLHDAGRLHYHFDGGVPGQGLDIASLLASPAADTHLYYCGPAGFMRACAEAASAWPAGTVHFEHFKAPVPDPARAASSGPEQPGDGRFTIRIHSTGALVEVGAEQSIVDALQCHGVHVETSCASGLCGTCKVRYLSGSVEHRDFILGDDEHGEFLTACVSRSASPVLELDL